MASLKESFTDRVQKAIEHGYKKVLVPRLLEATDRFVSETVHYILFKEGGKSTSRVGRTDYTKAGSTSLDDKYSDKKKRVTGYRTVECDERDEAEMILEQLKAIAESEYEVARVSDLYDLAQMTVVGETQFEKIGWNARMLTEGRVSYNGDKFEIRLPRPKPVDSL